MTMTASAVDPDGLMEFSVVFTDEWPSRSRM